MSAAIRYEDPSIPTATGWHTLPCGASVYLEWGEPMALAADAMSEADLAVLLGVARFEVFELVGCRWTIRTEPGMRDSRGWTVPVRAVAVGS